MSLGITRKTKGTIGSVISAQVTLVEIFLNEFCTINHIENGALQHVLRIISDPLDNSMVLVSADDIRNVKFGVKMKLHNREGLFSAHFYVYGECADATNYPETFAYIEDLKRDGIVEESHIEGDEYAIK